MHRARSCHGGWRAHFRSWYRPREGSVVGHEASCEQVSSVQSIRWELVFVMRHLARTEYITIISIMITMTVWDFVIGVLFGIIVSCEFKSLSPLILATMQQLTGSQVSSLLYKTPSDGASEHATRETLQSPLFAVQQLTAHTSVKCLNRHALSNCKDSSSLARSLTSKTPSDRSSTTPVFMLTRFALSSLIFRLSLGSTCQLRKRL